MIRVFARLRPLARAATLSAAVALAACGGESADDTAPPAPEPSTVPETVAVNLVAAMLHLEPAGIRVVSSQATQFSDGSLDCPEPGMSYAQVITPGHRVILEADGRRFDVRVAGRAGKICHPQKAPATGSDRDGRPTDGPGTARR